MKVLKVVLTMLGTARGGPRKRAPSCGTRGRRHLGVGQRRRIGTLVLFRAQVDVGQRAVIARRRHRLREQILERSAHLPDLTAVGFVELEGKFGLRCGLRLLLGFGMLVVVIGRVHAATGTGRVVALVLFQRGRKTGRAVVFRGEGITIDIILRARSVKVFLLLVQCRGQTTHTDIDILRLLALLHIHRFINIVHTVSTAAIATSAQRLTPAMMVMMVMVVHVVTARRRHVVMMVVAIILRVRLRRTARHPIFTRGPDLGQRTDAVPALVATAVGAAVVVDQVALLHVQVQLQDALLAAGELR